MNRSTLIICGGESPETRNDRVESEKMESEARRLRSERFEDGAEYHPATFELTRKVEELRVRLIKMGNLCRAQAETILSQQLEIERLKQEVEP